MKHKTKHFLTALVLMFLLSLVVSPRVNAASAEAKIGKTKYATLQQALKKVKSNQTIVLQKNVTLSSELTVSRSGKKFTLNLNKKTITFKNEATLNLKKGTMTVKNGTIKHKEKTGIILDVKKGATLKVESGTYKGKISNAGTMTVTKGNFISLDNKRVEPSEKNPNSPALLFNYPTGKITIHKGTFDAKKNILLHNVGTVTINGGTFKDSAVFDEEQGVAGDGLVVNCNEGKLTVNGGTFKSNVVVFTNAIDAEMTVNKASVTCKRGAVFTNIKSKLTVNDGTFKISEDWAVLYDILGEVTLNGGKYTTDWSVVETYDPDAKVTINGGTFTSKVSSGDQAPMLLNYSGEIDVKGGTFVSKKGYLSWIDKNAEKVGKIKLGKKATYKTKYKQKETKDPC